MANTYTRRITLFINGKQVSNDIKSVQAAMYHLTNQQRLMAIGSDEYVAHAKKIRYLKGIIAEHNADLRNVQTAWQKAKKVFSQFAPAAGFAAIGIGLKRFAQQSDEAFTNFQERVSNLSALTGLVGDDLNWLGDQAKKLSVSTQEGGVRITQSAQNIVDAFTKMGSARPELLKDKDALVEVTKQALILSSAAKIELQTAIDAVAASMNQFNLGASKSSEIINTLAAGSLAGSAEVQDITESLANVGTVAADSNLSLDQTVGLLETLAERQLKGAEAGTQLRSTLISLKAAGLGYESGVFNVRDAIVELRAKIDEQSTALEKDNVLIDIFGKRNITVGTILANSVDRYDEFTKAVTGTNTALEQAAKNTDNEAAKRAQEMNRIKAIMLEFGKTVAPVITDTTKVGRQLLQVILGLFKVLIENKGLIITITAGIVAYNVALAISNISLKENIILTKLKTVWDAALKGGLLLAAAAQALFTGNIIRANAAMKLFNQTTKLNPIGLIVSLLVAAGFALFQYNKKLNQVTAAQKALNDVEIIAQQNITEQKVKMEQLLRVAQNDNLTKERRKSAIAELNKISPEYLGNLSLETINTDAAKKATEDYITSLLQKAKVQAAEESLIELEKERIKTVQEGADYQSKWYQTAWNYAKSFGSVAAFAMNTASTGAKNAAKSQDEYNKKREALVGIIDKENKAQDISPVKPEAGNYGSPVTGLSDDQIKEQISILEAGYQKQQALARENYLKGIDSEDQYNENLLQAELKFLAEKLKIYDVGSKEYQEAVNKGLELLVNNDKRIKDLLIKEEQELAAVKLENIKDEFKKQEAAELQSWANEKAELEKKIIDKQNLSAEEIRLNETIYAILEAKKAEHLDRMAGIKTDSNISDLQNQVTALTPVNYSLASNDQLQQLLDAKTALITAQYEKEKALAGENKNAQLAAEHIFYSQLFDAQDEFIFNQGANIDFRIALNQAMYEKGLINEEQYQSALTQLTSEAEKKRWAIKQENIEKATELAGMATDLVTSLMDMELEKAGEDEEKKKQIKKKYADINFAVTAAQIIASTAGAIMKGFEQLGPIGGAIAAVLLGATGLLQLGVANAQRQKAKAMAKGKYPVQADDGKTYNAEFAGKPKTGMYGRKPQLAVFNEVPGFPETVIDGITTKKIQADYPAIFNAIYDIRDGRKPKQYATGKYPDQPISASPNQFINQSVNQTIDIDKFDKAVDRLLQMELNVNITEVRKRLDRLEERNKQSKLN